MHAWPGIRKPVKHNRQLLALCPKECLSSQADSCIFADRKARSMSQWRQRLSAERTCKGGPVLVLVKVAEGEQRPCRPANACVHQDMNGHSCLGHVYPVQILLKVPSREALRTARCALHGCCMAQQGRHADVAESYCSHLKSPLGCAGRTPRVSHSSPPEGGCLRKAACSECKTFLCE